MKLSVGVVGSGIIGSSAALALARRGHRVTIYDQHPPGHALGSSHGRSRIVRKAYPDRFWTELLLDAYACWRELEALAGQSLLHECGLLYFGPRDHPEIHSGAAGLNALHVEHRILEPEDVSELRLRPGEVGIFTPEAGWVDAGQAVAVTRHLAREAGATWLPRRVEPDERLEHDRLVVAPGPWIDDWGLPGWTVSVTLQTFAYFRGVRSGPVWIEAADDHPYGFPSEPGSRAFKMALHHPGPVVDPRGPRPAASEAALARLAEVARSRFMIETPEVVEVGTCLYTNRPDEGFRIEAREDAVLISACSGHAFKFGPWLGRVVADVVGGSRPPLLTP